MYDLTNISQKIAMIGLYAHVFLSMSFYFKKYGFLNLATNFLISLALSLVLLLLTLNNKVLYITIVAVLFSFHNYIDLKKYNKIILSYIFLALGVISSLYFYIDPISNMAIFIIYIIGIFHYIFWYLIAKVNGKRDKFNFFIKVALYNSLIAVIFLFSKDSMTQYFFSLTTFFFISSHHIFFSYTSKKILIK